MKSKHSNKPNSSKLVWIMLTIALIFIAYLGGKANALKMNSVFNQNLPSPAPTIAIIVTPTLLPSPTTKLNNQKRVYPTTNPDPPVLCNVNAKCGGGTKPLRQSECDNSTCCEINGKWIFYKDKSQCIRDQGSSGNTGSNPVIINTNNNSTKTPVFLSYGGYTVYCPPQNVGAVMSINSTMESKKTQWATDYNSCSSTFFKTDSCYVSCSSTDGNAWSACSYGSSDYNDCMKKADDNYSNCISKCPSASSACDWAYAEQKSLSNQISNLCN
jgi:hypothetical protein